MSGKRLLDLVAVFQATRGVAQKHVALRSKQVDLYNRTSTLAKAIRHQTERVTETAKAASFLISRLNEDLPAWTNDRSRDTTSTSQQYSSQVRPESSESSGSKASESNIPTHTVDGFIQPTSSLSSGHDNESLYTRSRHESPNKSSQPEVVIPTHASEEQVICEGSINSDSFYDPAGAKPGQSIPSTEAIPEQEEIPDGLNTDIFHSPRVARLLGGKAQSGKAPELELQGVKDTPVEHTPLSSDKDQDTFNVRQSSDHEPSVPEVNIKQSSGSPVNILDEKSDASTVAFSPRIDPTTEDLPGEITREESLPYELRESRVPSSRLGRLWNYAGLGAGMMGGVIGESMRRLGGSGSEGSYFLTAGNMDRLVTKLSRMRGAALKLGQMISFQDSKMLPVPIQEVLQRVQDRADYMPAAQRDQVLTSNIGENWRDLFSSFEEKPMAAASIGQVHSAVLSSNGARVAVKVQYPGVAGSIDSDLNNLAILLTASRLLPKGLFLDKTIANARTELAWECDYIREAECGRRFEKLLADENDVFVVPKVYPEASGKQVLTMEFMEGIGVTRVQSFSQEQKDWIGTQILRLCLREITEFRFMQTDPNWTNFLYNAKSNKLELLDFGASREYPEEFISNYSRLLAAASKRDKITLRDLSVKLGYLTGAESKAMLDAHISSILTLAEPFLESSPKIYDFKDQTITDRVKDLIPVMIRERLSPPPEETYSLHRKLSGAFLLCARLGSRVPCRKLFEDSMTKAKLL